MDKYHSVHGSKDHQMKAVCKIMKLFLIQICVWSRSKKKKSVVSNSCLKFIFKNVWIIVIILWQYANAVKTWMKRLFICQC